MATTPTAGPSVYSTASGTGAHSSLKQLAVSVNHASDINNDVDTQPSYQSNSAQSNSTSSPMLRTRTPVPYDPGNLEVNDPTPSTTDSTTTASRGHTRKSSLTDSVLAGAATAASGAATAASSVVAAARRLVLHDDEEEILEGKSVAEAVDADGNSKSILPSFLKPDSVDHQGLEFSQRRLSSDHTKKPPGSGSNPGSTPSSSHNFASTSGDSSGGSVTVLGNVSGANVGANNHGTELISGSRGGAGYKDINGAGVGGSSDNGHDYNHNKMDNISENHTGAPNARFPSGQDPSTPASVGMEQASGGGSGFNPMTDTARSDTERRGSSSTTGSRTMYVSGRDPESAPHQGMNVDRPSVSRTTASSGAHSSMGVDAPVLVGDSSDHPARRPTGGLNVDKKHASNTDPKNGHPVHVQDNNDFENSASADSQLIAPTIPPAPTNAKINQVKNGEEQYHSTHYRRPSATGLNVDARNTKSSSIASTPQVHENQSAINVDKARSADRTRSGMNVDGIATSSVHLSEASHDPEIKASKAGAATSIRSDRRGSDRSLLDKVKGTFLHPEGDSSTYSQRDIVSSGQTAQSSGNLKTRGNDISIGTAGVTEATGYQPSSAYGSSSGLSTFAGGGSLSAVPAGYDGPIPQVAPGEEIVWVKHIIKTDYYENEGEVSGVTSRRGSVGSFLDRIRGGGDHHNGGVDKGKQRA
ncbi:hypothetical protein BGZ83_009556 [Gryganskiella cystojenkinii]|nr:hypothetical protein BGZ83_009556 [Gryganskiella cystojenkinii]